MIGTLVNEALDPLNGLFNVIVADTGRASIAPEKLMWAMLNQVLTIDDEVWDHPSSTLAARKSLQAEIDAEIPRHRGP